MTERVVGAKTMGARGLYSDGNVLTHLLLFQAGQRSKTSQANTRSPMTPGSHEGLSGSRSGWYGSVLLTQIGPVALCWCKEMALIGHSLTRCCLKTRSASHSRQAQ